jgi:hypothetical protein
MMIIIAIITIFMVIMMNSFKIFFFYDKFLWRFLKNDNFEFAQNAHFCKQFEKFNFLRKFINYSIFSSIHPPNLHALLSSLSVQMNAHFKIDKLHLIYYRASWQQSIWLITFHTCDDSLMIHLSAAYNLNTLSELDANERNFGVQNYSKI